MAGSGNDANTLIDSFKISTLNTRGFKNKKKRSSLIRIFKQQKLEIIVLQETHKLSEYEERELSLQWGGHVHYSSGTARSKGLITLFNSCFPDSCIKLI